MPLDAFVRSTYARLERGIERGALPPATQHFTRAMIADDWLGAFARFEGVEASLGRLNYAIRRRFGRDVNLIPLADELRRLETALAASFPPLFVELERFVGERSALRDRA